MTADLTNIMSGDLMEACDLKAAVECRWSCSADLVQTVPVSIALGGERTWDVIVHIFDLPDCPKASRAYAWTSKANAESERRIFSSLQGGPINTPVDAVGAAAADELRAQRLAMARPQQRRATPLTQHEPLFRLPASARLN